MNKYQKYPSTRDYDKEHRADKLSTTKPKRSGNKCSNPHCKKDRGANRYFCKQCHSEASSKYGYI